MSLSIKTALWLASSIIFLMLLFIPIDTSAQIAAVSVAVVAAGLLKILQPKGALRMVALAIATVVVVRYVYWRATETLPPVSDLASFIPGIMLYAAELYSVIMLGLSLFVVAHPRPERATPPIPAVGAPSVDVFIPSYNEPAELLERTLTAALSMDYPRDCFVVYLLDDGGTEEKRSSDDPEIAAAAMARHIELQALCERIGARYLTRARNEKAKAGNLNHGMAHSSGELIAVFDADHIPAPDFLRETVGHFLEEDELFLVQTPHFFANPDPVERNMGIHGRMPSENEMFYGMIQRGLDHWNGSFFCGSAAVMRRIALEQTDGFSGRSITEDCETALALHAKGWNSRYVSKQMISGLQPETFASFIGQRSRWAQGMIQILMLNRPQLKGGLTLAQRLCYSSSILFWLFPFARLAFLVAPLFYLLFDMRIFIASGSDFLAYTLSYMVASLLIQNMLYGGFRRPWMSEVYEFVQSFHLGAAVVAALLRPTRPTFRVTAKDELSHRDQVSELAGLFYAVFAALVLLQGYAAYRLVTEPENFWLLTIVSGWNMLNLLLSMCALGAVNERRSTAPVAEVQHKAELIFGDDAAPLPVTITAISTSEARLQLGRDAAPLDGLKREDAGRLQLADGTNITVAMKDTAPDKLAVQVLAGNTAEIGQLIYDQPLHWRKYDMARKPTGVIMGTLDFIVLAFTQLGRGIFGPMGKRGAPELRPQPASRPAQEIKAA